MTLPPRLFAARLAGLPVFDPLGDPVGRVRDLVLLLGGRSTKGPRAVGLVIEVVGRRRVFVPATRVTSIAPGQVITTGLVNLRRFQQLPDESVALVVGGRRREVAHPRGRTHASPGRSSVVGHARP